MEVDAILDNLPYTYPFLFVDGLEEISEHGVTGYFTFSESSFFYQGHFKDRPVTPGVILTECMAQIGLVCLGIYLLHRSEEEAGQTRESDSNLQIAMSNAHVDFFLPVLPGEKVTVCAEKEYFRFQKLKCSVQMRNAEGKLVCKGTISGMISRNG